MTAVTTARAATLALLALREPGATICPSDVGRALSVAESADANTASSWRSAMPMVHDAVDSLVAEGLIALSWKGQRLLSRSGPYRIGRSRSP